jgi:hypothetical protein
MHTLSTVFGVPRRAAAACTVDCATLDACALFDQGTMRADAAPTGP